MTRSAQSNQKHYLSPVDYEAWGKGYMPPSEHILIDQIAYRGARIILSADSGKPDGPAYWLVVRGKTNPKKVGLAIYRLMADWEDEELATAGAETPVTPAPTVSPPGDKASLPPDEQPNHPHSGEG